MNVLVVGRGGREHAICWKLRQSPKLGKLYCAPGNAGTAREGINVPIDSNDLRGLVQFAKKQDIGLTVVGPEDPLVNGIVDLFQREGLRIFGPSQAAAELEGSKIFSKEMMRRAGIPTADFRVFTGAPEAERYLLSREVMLTLRPKGLTPVRGPQICQTAVEAMEMIDRILLTHDPYGPVRNAEADIEIRGERKSFSNAAEAKEYVLTRPMPVVVKADGLAAGKGVVVCDNIRQALDAVKTLMVDRAYGRAGDRILIEERLDGPETSVMVLTDGKTIIPLESSQDHKRIFDNDRGPNTGGMGAYSPAPKILTPELMAMVERDVLVPAIHTMKRAKRPFKGLLYAGLILTNQGPRVLEFNVRFGDPECQAVLMRLQTDFLDVLNAVVDESLDALDIRWDPRPSVCVVLASDGYPASSDRGKIIPRLDDADALPDVKVFHAGTRTLTEGAENAKPPVVTDGGRVLGVTALGVDIVAAREQAYKAVDLVAFQGARFRKDIGQNAIS